MKLATLRNSISNELFERPFLKSCYFLVRDLLLSFISGYLALLYIPFDAYFFWTFWSVIQGTIVMGLWVIGHECGHGAFSSSQMVDDVVGFILHSLLLVPYFTWQRSHAVHHARTNHLVDGETHNPDLRKKVEPMYNALRMTVGEYGLILFNILFHLFFGWPMYLFFHTTGSRRSPITKQKYSKKPDHFSVNEFFPSKMRFKVTLSVLGCLGTIVLLIAIGYRFGYGLVLRMYCMPYLVVNAWLVTYTWLHHTHTNVPHYGEKEWTWLQGALSTIDRPYPWIIDELHHHIGSTHVLHHVFSNVPHYHAQEATKQLQQVLKEKYNYDPTPILSALWNTARDCQFVDEREGIQFFKSIFS